MQLLSSIALLELSKMLNYYYIKLSAYKRIIWYYPSGWAHAPRISYPQSRDTGAACQVASHSKHGEQVKNSSLMCVSFAQIAQTNLSHSPHSNSFSSILIFPSLILQILVLGFCLWIYSLTKQSEHCDFWKQFSHLNLSFMVWSNFEYPCFLGVEV